MRYKFWQRQDPSNVTLSRLYDQTTFYEQFVCDLHQSRSRVIIESPFITRKRLNMMLPELNYAIRRGVRLIINTRDPIEHEAALAVQALEAVSLLQGIDATVIFTGGLHRKLAIIDDDILWEGSLNILSQCDSCELMRRTTSIEAVDQMAKFIELR